MILSYKYRLSSKSATKQLRNHAIAVNQVWNWAVAYQRHAEAQYKAGAKPQKWPSHYDLQKLCKGVGAELGLHQQSVVGVCRQFTVSRQMNKGAPAFRKSFGSNASRGWVPFEQQSRQITNNSVTYLGKRYPFFGSKRRPLPTGAKGGAFVEDSLGRWWVTFHVEIPERTTNATGEVGIDLGLKTLASLSDGNHVPSLQHYRSYERKLAVAQRAGNKRRAKAIHVKITNARKDQHHKATTEIVRQNCFIAVGDVRPTPLAKTRMAKSVLDAGWSGFRSMLLYKARLLGVEVKVVNEAWSTQLCSECNEIGGPKGIAQLGMRTWECGHCGTIHDRDTNAAKNILRSALSARGLGEESRETARGG